MTPNSTQQESDLEDPNPGYRAKPCSLPTSLGPSRNKTSAFYIDTAPSNKMHFQSSRGGCKTAYWTQLSPQASLPMSFLGESWLCVLRQVTTPLWAGFSRSKIGRTRWFCHSLRSFQPPPSCALPSLSPPPSDLDTRARFNEALLLLEVRVRDVKLLEIFKSWKQNFQGREWNMSSFQCVFLGPCTGPKSL